jgi:hypothetical protein
MGFFNWIRRRVHRESTYANDYNEAFDEETSELIEAGDDLIERMRRRSVNLTKQRVITHLFVGEDHNLQRASKLLSTMGYLIEEVGDGRLLVSEHHIVDETWVRHATPAMVQTAGEFDLTYDGWDAEVAADYTGQDN